MKRILAYILVALHTFCFGMAFSVLIRPSLKERLDAIDRKYENLCAYPKAWEVYKEYEDLDELERCRAEWREARRLAIEGK